MPKFDIKNLKSLQKTIKVAVDFYDAEEREKLMAYPTAFRIQQLVEQGMDIPVQEFLTYYLYRRKRPGMPGFRNYGELGRHTKSALADLDGFIEFNGKSISTAVGVGDQDPHITERIGESVGLSVVGAIHGLIEADWGRLPIIGGRNGRPSFDYDVAADAENIIQAETKGSSTDDPGVRTNSIRNQKRSIKEKRETINELEREDDYPYKANLRYGTITVIGKDPESTPRCLLVDPPAEGNSQSARRVKILNRLRFMRDWITFLSPRSQLASALHTRVAALEVWENVDLNSVVPLLKGNGELFNFGPVRYRQQSSFFAYKSRISDGPGGGVCLPLDRDRMLFLGVRDELLQDAANQNFNVLSQKQYQSGVLDKTIECVFSATRYRTMSLPPNIRERISSSGSYVEFDLTGTIYYSRSGILFGVLPLNSLR